MTIPSGVVGYPLGVSVLIPSSGPIGLANFLGSIAPAVIPPYVPVETFKATISSNQTNLNLRTWALANGWNGTLAAEVTVDTGIYIYGTVIGGAGLTIDGSWPGGITLVNKGYILGLGGDGGGIDSPTIGHTAISLGVNCSINNASYICGGGGGGGYGFGFASGGGGAGGGAGGKVLASGVYYQAAGGGAGALGADGVTLSYPSSFNPRGGGGGGGRIPQGAGGAGGVAGPAQLGATRQAGGSGGSGGGGGGAYIYNGDFSGGVIYAFGGSGGSGSGGGDAVVQITSSASPINQDGDAAGGGGGWGAAGGQGMRAYSDGTTNYAAGAAGGNSVALNGYAVSWLVVGTRYGAVT